MRDLPPSYIAHHPPFHLTRGAGARQRKVPPDL